MENHFADLELEVRTHLADPEFRRKAFDYLAKTILSDLVKIERPASANSTFIGASVPLLFSEGMIKGVASVIADELGKNAEPKKPSKKQIKKQEWSDQVDPKILKRLSTRAQGVCWELGFLTLEEMRAASDVDYLLVPRCGKGTLHEIKQFLARDGEPTAEESRDELKFARELDAALEQALLNRSSQT